MFSLVSKLSVKYCTFDPVRTFFDTSRCYRIHLTICPRQGTLKHKCFLYKRVKLIKGVSVFIRTKLSDYLLKWVKLKRVIKFIKVYLTNTQSI